MVVKLHNTDKWSGLAPGKLLSFDGSAPRVIRVDFNCPEPTRLDLVDLRGKVTFLAVVHGRETVEFTAVGDVDLVATADDEIWYFTDYGDGGGAYESYEASFTKLANRRVRNPDLELMMFKAEQRINARLALLDQERAAVDEAKRSAGASAASSAPKSSEPADDDAPADEGAASDVDDEKSAVSA